MNDLLIPAAIQLGSIVAAVWILTEVVGNILRRARKDLLALVLGPAMAVAGYATGFVTAIPLTGAKGYAGAAFAGLISTLTAKAFHDYLLNPFLKRQVPPAA